MCRRAVVEGMPETFDTEWAEFGPELERMPCYRRPLTGDGARSRRHRCLSQHGQTARRRSRRRAGRARRRIRLAADRPERERRPAGRRPRRDGAALVPAPTVCSGGSRSGARSSPPPEAERAAGKFRLDYSGRAWKERTGSCRPYDGPALAWFVTGCTAADGSYWTVQSWQRALPDLGFTPWLATQTVWELHISHWTGETAELELHTDWVYNGRWEELFGRLTYRGVPVHGFKSTHRGVTLDGYGRNLYLDTYDSVYGAGWRRENGFLVHNPNGNFCYGFYPFRTAYYAHPTGSPSRRGPGVGVRYRINVIGPGVTPGHLGRDRRPAPLSTRGAPPTSPTRRSRTHSVASSPSATSSAGTARRRQSRSRSRRGNPGRWLRERDAHRSRPGLSPGVVGPRRCAHGDPASGMPAGGCAQGTGTTAQPGCAQA